MGDLPYVEWLARTYTEKGETTRCWSDYLKVSLASYKCRESKTLPSVASEFEQE